MIPVSMFFKLEETPHNRRIENQCARERERHRQRWTKKEERHGTNGRKRFYLKVIQTPYTQIHTTESVITNREREGHRQI